MMSTISSKLNLLVLDDKFGRINSHWAFSTKNLDIVSRIYYDEKGFEENLFNQLNLKQVDVIGYSGRGAIEADKKIRKYLKNKSTTLFSLYHNTKKIMKLHNTNLSEFIEVESVKINDIKEKGNDWVKIALNHPFDCVFVQTYGDAEIINRYCGNDKAVWVPYAYNDSIFYDRNCAKMVDIGAYFKLDRHEHRIEFIKRIERFAKSNNYTFEFSDSFWGKEYAEKISQAKIIVHLSYCGDIPWRLYESAASKACFITDPLKFNVSKLFSDSCYAVYKRNFDDLESKLKFLLENSEYRGKMVHRAGKEVEQYAWSRFSEQYIVPLIRSL